MPKIKPVVIISSIGLKTNVVANFTHTGSFTARLDGIAAALNSLCSQVHISPPESAFIELDVAKQHGAFTLTLCGTVTFPLKFPLDKTLRHVQQSLEFLAQNHFPLSHYNLDLSQVFLLKLSEPAITLQAILQKSNVKEGSTND